MSLSEQLKKLKKSLRNLFVNFDKLSGAQRARVDTSRYFQLSRFNVNNVKTIRKYAPFEPHEFNENTFSTIWL